MDVKSDSLSKTNKNKSLNIHNISPTHQGLLTLTAIAFITTVAVIILNYPKVKQIQKTRNPNSLNPPEQSEEIVQTSTNTNSWKTYINKEYNYTFSYPASASIKENVFNEGDVSINRIDYSGGWSYNILFTVYNTGANQSLEEVVKNKYNIVGDYVEPQNIPYDTFSDVRFKIYKLSSVNLDYDNLRFIALVTPNQGVSSGLSLNQAYIRNSDLNRYILMENIIPTNSSNTPLFDQILSTFQFLPDTSEWDTYTNEQYGFESQYYYDSPPSEVIGTEDVGQFTYLMQVKFGTVPLKSVYGYTIEVSKKSLEDLKLELVGHNTDSIDSEEVFESNDISWTKLNYQIFLTTNYIPITSAFVQHNGLSYMVTADSLNIDRVLSTFKFTDIKKSSLTKKLVYITYTGGICPNGEVCKSSKLILKDGSSTSVDGIKSIEITPGEIQELTKLVNSTNYEFIRLRPFTGTCPTAYDGQEITYIFFTTNGEEKVSSCETAIDNNSQLFSKLNTLLGD